MAFKNISFVHGCFRLSLAFTIQMRFFATNNYQNHTVYMTYEAQQLILTKNTRFHCICLLLLNAPGLVLYNDTDEICFTTSNYQDKLVRLEHCFQKANFGMRYVSMAM